MSDNHINKIKRRNECNNKIILRLSEYVNKYPEIRFLQALYNLDIVKVNEDQWYEESQDTLENMVKENKNGK